MTRRSTLLGTLGAGTAIVAASRIRRGYLRLGATRDEHAGPHPGDSVVSHPNVVATRAIGIEVPPARVWPWLVQIGQDRAGFYSYDKLENLAGCDIHSVDRIVPEWQQLQLGDSVTLEPGVQLRVAELEIARHLVLAGRVPLGPALIPAEFSWSFLLQERPAGATRLLSRVRYAHLRWWSPPMVEAVEIIDTIMTRRMLRAIKALAERDSDSEQRRPQ